MDTKEQRNTNEEIGVGRVVNFRPVFLCVLFLLLGIFVAYLQVVEKGNALLSIVLVLLLPLPFFFFVRKKQRFFVCVAVLYAAFLLGNGVFSSVVGRYQDAPTYNGEYYVVGIVTEKNPTSSGGELVLTDLTIDGEQVDGQMTINANKSIFTALDFCDEVKLLLDVSTYNRIEGNYGFRAEAIADGQIYRGSNVAWYEVQGRAFRPFSYLRGKLQDTLYASMGDEGAAVATAILFGNTSGIEEGLLENVRYGGIAHVFAVSGLHIGSAFAFCLFLFRRNRIPAPFRFIITASVLLLYGGICGYSASVVRAIITCLVGYGCTLLGVKYDPLESLSLAALIVFTLYPTLVFGVGAQLSFGACLGILLLAKPLRVYMEKCGKTIFSAVRKLCKKPIKSKSVDMFRRNSSPQPLWVEALEKGCSFLSVSFAAQIATIPILYNAFGYFSVASIFLNCLYVPLMSVSFSWLLLLTVISTLFPLAAGGFMYIPNLCINLFMLPFHMLELQVGIIEGSGLSTQAVLCYYGGWIFVSDKFHLKKWQKWGMVGVFFLSFIICLLL